MLTRVLLIHFARTAAVILLLGAALAWMLLGQSAALALLAAGAVVSLNCAGIIWVVGKLLDPGGTAASKGGVTFVLMGKLAVVGGILWYLFAVKGMHELGMLLGIGLAIVSLVLGVNQGSTSPEGKRAISEAEKEIAQEMGDNEKDSQ